jgi:hypothetical protein
MGKLTPESQHIFLRRIVLVPATTLLLTAGVEFKPFEPGIEVNGQTVYTIVDGFRLFKRVASAVLEREGIGRMRDDGDLIIDREGWYSQDKWLRAFARIADETGSGALFAIGRQIPRTPNFHPG